VTILPLLRPSGNGATRGLIGAFSIVFCFDFVFLFVFLFVFVFVFCADVDCNVRVFCLLGNVILSVTSLLPL